MIGYGYGHFSDFRTMSPSLHQTNKEEVVLFMCFHSDMCNPVKKLSLSENVRSGDSNEQQKGLGFRHCHHSHSPGALENQRRTSWDQFTSWVQVLPLSDGFERGTSVGFKILNIIKWSIHFL